MLRAVAIKDLRPNPFRRLEEYPIRREKVETLKNSIEHTGFWRTIVGRPAPGGIVEVAFGHHRLVALREMFGPDHCVEILVENLSNENMIQMMANENLAEWGSDGWVEVETVRATIEAYGKGLIRLPDVPPNTRKDRIRYVGLNLDRPYTRLSVATFLGWLVREDDGFQPDPKCDTAFSAIDAMDAGIVMPAQLRADGLARYKIRQLCDSARKIRRAELEVARRNKEEAAKAREEAGRATTARDRARLEKQAEVFRKQAEQHEADAEARSRDFMQQAAPRLQGRAGLDEVRDLARKMAAVAPQGRKIPDVDGIAARLASKLALILNGDDGLSAQLEILREFRGELSAGPARELARAATLLRLRLEKKIVQVYGVD